MRMRCATIIVIGLLFSGCSSSQKGLLAIQSPGHWKIEYQKTSVGLEIYALTARTPDEGLLIFSQWPPPGRPDDIPALVQRLADEFQKGAKNSPGFTLTSEKYEIEQFVGDHCQGRYAVFQITSEGTSAVQTIFMMSVDGQIWNGQFTGKPNAWTNALALLKSLKRNG